MEHSPARTSDSGFWTFYRQYARTGIHAASTAALTAFGLLTFVHRGFVVVAVAAYVVPPIYLYATRKTRETREPTGERVSESEREGTTRETREQRDVDEPTGESTSEREDADADETESDAESDEDGANREWTVAETPTDEALHDAAVASDGRACAVGDGGVLLARGDDAWERVLERGPGQEANALRGADATADGEAVWFAGDGGALGRYDATTGRFTDFSAPDDRTSTWNDVAVAGERGAESLYLVTGSGIVVRGRNGGGDLSWDDGTKPGSGSSATGITFASPTVGYVCDSSGGVFETRDGGDSWTEIGIDDAGTLRDVAVGPVAGGEGDEGDVPTAYAVGDGTVFRYDGDAGRWTGETVSDGRLRAISGRDGETLAVGADGCYRLVGTGWRGERTPAFAGFDGCAVGDDLLLAVGEDGTVVEYR